LPAGRVERPRSERLLRALPLVGLRRVGNSVILRQLSRRLADRGKVVFVDKEDLASDDIRDAQDLVRCVDSRRL
jgi:predicted AAA+ superfamily ATPase